MIKKYVNIKLRNLLELAGSNNEPFRVVVITSDKLLETISSTTLKGPTPSLKN